MKLEIHITKNVRNDVIFYCIQYLLALSLLSTTVFSQPQAGGRLFL